MVGKAAVIPPPGPHGGDGARLATALGVDPGAVLDLSASLNPAAPDPAGVVGKHLDALSRYPDPSAATEALAGALGVDPERLLLTNGGAQAIALVASEVGGGPASEPDFGLYPRGPGGPRWRSDPHNPSGQLARPGAEAGVWDEAFYPLATGRWTAGRAGAITLGSLTKVFACPGLRAGYVVVPEGDRGLAWADRLRHRQPAWSVNGLVAAALPGLLERADLAGWAEAVAVWRADLAALLASHGLGPEPSDANFVLVHAPGLRARLAPHGVLVRDCTSFGLAGYARVAVPDPSGLRRLAAALGAS